MKKINSVSSYFLIFIFFLFNHSLHGQNPIPWLNDYTSDINTGSYTYKYSFTTVDNKDCKLKIEEQKTDKKGNSVIKSYVFFLSDLDPSKFIYKPTGSTMIVTLATKSSQKFVAIMGNNGLEEYTNSVIINLDAVDKARSFIDIIKSHCDECKASDIKWSTQSDAFNWLNTNIGESMNGSITVKQTFSKGDRDYLAEFITETSDSKGTSKKLEHVFDLSDINSNGILLEISGKTLKVVLPVKESDYYIRVNTDNQVSYSKEVEIFLNDIEIARNTINALNYLVINAKPDRKEWENYSQALDFVKNNLKEITVGSTKLAQELSYEVSPSGKAIFKTIETDSKGIQNEELNSFYFTDIAPLIKLNVTSKNAYLGIDTKEKAKYIKQTSKDKTTGYTSTLKLYVDDIDQARDMITALEFASKNSAPGKLEFVSVEKAIEWLNKNPGDVTIDTKSYHQTIQFNPGAENKMDLNRITSDATGAGINERFELYPEDLSVEDLKIKVSGKKLYVPLTTGKSKFIKVFKGDVQQSYSGEEEYMFEDIQVAKNFIEAMTCIQAKSVVSDRSFNDQSSAFAFLVDNITGLVVEGKNVEQKIEQVESNACKLKYTLTETDSKGASIENSYEFILSDIDIPKSLVTISSKDLKINLVTKEKQKLIKPYKNGEPGSFIYVVDIYTDDVLTAKKILAAISTIYNDCK